MATTTKLGGTMNETSRDITTMPVILFVALTPTESNLTVDWYVERIGNKVYFKPGVKN